MKLKDILKEISEDVCERLPNESEADFLTRCGNQAFARLDKMRMDQTLGTYTRNVVKETHDRKELELTRLKLMNQAFKLLPNSPKQLAVRKEIERIDKILKGLKEVEESEEDWMARKTEEILAKYKETRLRGLGESNNTNPSSAMRDEPHPTRHETEHPPIEKTAFKRLDPFKEPTKK
jgi:hypothetical protein